MVAGALTLEEAVANLSNRDWRLRNLYEIFDPWGRPVPFRPNVGQEWYLANRNHWNLITKARRNGFSTIIGICDLDYVAFNESQHAGLIDLTITDAKKKLGNLAHAWETVGLNVPGLSDGDRIRLRALLHAAAPMKATETELEFGNGSTYTCSTTFRGGALQRLHVSEFGPMAMHRPLDAKKILTGALPTVAVGNQVNFESTHKGGRFGEHFDLIEEAMGSIGKPHGIREFKLLFFPFQQNPANRLPADSITLREVEIQILKQYEQKGIVLEPEQKAFWASEFRKLKHDIYREWPACLEDIFRSPVEGSIYGEQLAEAEAQGRVGDFGVDDRWPCFVAWDLGFSDAMSMWLIQVTKLGFRVLDYYENSGEKVAHYVRKVAEWNAWAPVSMNLLPHDAEQTSRSGRTFIGDAREAGLKSCLVVPQTRDIWIGINEARSLMADAVWHSRTKVGRELLGAYRKNVAEDGKTLRPGVVHDHTSHAADGFRTFAEAWKLGMVSPHIGSEPQGASTVEVLGV
jgi:hypothetical protein